MEVFSPMSKPSFKYDPEPQEFDDGTNEVQKWKKTSVVEQFANGAAAVFVVVFIVFYIFFMDLYRSFREWWSNYSEIRGALSDD